MQAGLRDIYVIIQGTQARLIFWPYSYLASLLSIIANPIYHCIAALTHCTATLIWCIATLIHPSMPPPIHLSGGLVRKSVKSPAKRETVTTCDE